MTTLSDSGMTIGVSGHRPPRLGLSYSIDSDHRLLTGFARAYLSKLSPPTSLISGTALGWDLAVAQAAVDLKIPLIAAIPFLGQESRWAIDSQRLYRRLISQALFIVNVGDKSSYSPQLLFQRNHWIVDHSSELLVIFDGSRYGGTYDAIEYAKSRHVTVRNLWSDWLKFRNGNHRGPL